LFCGEGIDMLKFWKRVRFIAKIRKFIPFLFEFFTSKEVEWSKKCLSLLFILGYIVFPFDIIPDFLTFFGFLDDITILTIVLQQMIKMAPEQMKKKYRV
jgi:uncharacterized membrane protein YkvA (DUF1232 family)